MLGYNYIENPIVRLMRRILDSGAIGAVNHVRIEMDEDFMADPDAPLRGRTRPDPVTARSTISACIP